MKKLAFIVSENGWLFEKTLKAINAGLLVCDLCLLLTNNKNACAIDIAEKYKIKFKIIPTKGISAYDYSHKYISIIQKYEIDYTFTMFNRIFSQEFANSLSNRAINLHLSLLPAFTGLNPRKNMLIYGSRFGGATLHFIDSGIDTGPVISQAIFPIDQNDGINELFVKYGKILPKLLINTIDLLINDQFEIIDRKVFFRKATFTGHQYSPDLKAKIAECNL